MIDENQFRQMLFEGTLLVKRLATGEVDLVAFIGMYANFYYYHALDGHEPDTHRNLLIRKYEAIVELHRRIQTEIIDPLYLGSPDQMPQYLAAGRISPEQALDRLKEIARSCGVDRFLLDLQK